jgi:diphosphomevalonate decarboxylase
LNNCKTITKLTLLKKKVQILFLWFAFEGKPKEDFKPKIQKFLERIEIYLPS